MSSTNNKDVMREWQESAPYWAKHAAIVRSMFAPITSALIETAAIDQGHFVLDVAGGAGEPSLTIAEVVGPSGSVVCTDAVKGMVLTSRNEASHRNLTNIEFTQCVGEALPFSSDTFDKAVCRLGVMLFPEAAPAIAEMLRVLKPAGRVAFAVWHTSDSNPFFHIVASIVSRYVESPPQDPDAPGAFRFAERGRLAGLLVDAGATEVNERLLRFSLETPTTPRQFWELRSELSDTLRAKLAVLSPELVSSLAREVEEAGRAFYDAGRMRFPAEVLIVSGAAK